MSHKTRRKPTRDVVRHRCCGSEQLGHTPLPVNVDHPEWKPDITEAGYGFETYAAQTRHRLTRSGIRYRHGDSELPGRAPFPVNAGRHWWKLDIAEAGYGSR